ncbi:DUF2309 domain-containing protein [Alicyclobacillus tolerans]|uniref:Probable inorganic carbon transporter subunit DabA n=1 Tax=Alicyclobacillus tolerans TaxID=90970 RepID=A0ABT9LTE5_9BACL|nr:putative inorganic carbon transporter subunit DabA [Alicyclobacillus tengchongensis]MDP9727538.1 uncharacterized protein YbcC (UPF0753/DUF2309 family) [Alicyclobacillus tengchongensis]
MDGTVAWLEKENFQAEKCSENLYSVTSIQEIQHYVEMASRVIAPLGPITEFAARNPWQGLEHHSFTAVAKWLKETHHVDILPSAALLKDAKNRGEIHASILKNTLEKWLDHQSFHLPNELVRNFCNSALEFDELPPHILDDLDIKILAEDLSYLRWPVKMNRRVQSLSFQVTEKLGVQITEELNRQMMKWCKLYLGKDEAKWAMPHSQNGFYQAWRRLAPYDPELTRSQRQLVKNCPHEATEALQEALLALKIPSHQVQEYLEAHLLSLPGWAGMLLWKSQEFPETNLLLIDYLAIRISLERILLQPYLPLSLETTEEYFDLAYCMAAWYMWANFPIQAWKSLSISEQREYMKLAYCFNDLVRRQMGLQAWEKTYEERLKMNILPMSDEAIIEEKSMAQWAFCIDTRSEPFRRALEKAGPFETIGVAGFFGLPIETYELDCHHGHASLPVILKPKHRIMEMASPDEWARYKSRKQAKQLFARIFKNMKQNMLASLLLPELSGPWLSVNMLARSFFPNGAGRLWKKVHHHWMSKPSTRLSLDFMQDESKLPMGLTDKEKVNYVRQSLQLMSLTDNFSPLIVICGHGSRSTNNPYASALDCGACGGASGSFNARVLAMLCNQSNVRERLATEGICIPEHTVFVAAEHITTFNEIRWLYVPELTDEAERAFHRIQEVLPKVSEIVNKEQIARLPNLNFYSANSQKMMQRFSEDWSEVRPEWGLAQNAAFIIGTRKLTKAGNFGGRVFLHTYDWQQDKDGTILSNIIAGPATVAQWINLQYYASTVAPHYYGSGNKATQTVTANFGVMQGNASDLLTGLPWQSVMKSDYNPYHAPLRLLVVIEAPYHYVENLLIQDVTFRQKIENGWIRLASIDEKGHWINWFNSIHEASAEFAAKEGLYE